MGYGSREMWREDFMSMMDDEYDEPVLFDEFSSYAAKYESFEGMYPVAVYEETKEGFGSDSTWPEDLEEKVSRRKQKPDDGSVSDLPGFMRLRDFNLPDTGTGKVNKLKRDLRMEALKRIEDSARTVADFNKVIEWHDALDANERSRVRKHELYRSGDDLPLDYGADENGDGQPDYIVPVTFWMPFDGGEGLHDVSTRSAWGGDVYTYSGSHGCVNLPYSAAGELWDNTEVGTVVVVHD
jgi:hypothetical protein